MRKLVIRLLLALVLVLLMAVLAISLFLDGAVKRAVERFGPGYTKVDIKLNSVSLRLLSGSGKLTGLFVGNPEGFKARSAITMSNATLSIITGSVFSEKVIINFITIQAIEVTYETSLTGNNLSKILSNLQETTGGNQPAPGQTAGKPAKKFQVDDFLIRGGRVRLGVNTPLGAPAATVPLPAIHLTDLGAGPGGITSTELAKRILDEIQKETAKAATGKIADLEKGATHLTKDLGKTSTNAFGKITKGIGDLFRKKKTAGTNE